MPAALKFGHLAESILEAQQSRHKWLRPLDARMLCRLVEGKLDPVHLGNHAIQSVRRLHLHHLANFTDGQYSLSAKGWELIHEAAMPEVA